jgi:hypothetical protein
VKRAATRFSKARLRTRTVPRRSGGRAGRGDIDSRRTLACGGVCGEGTGDNISVTWRRGSGTGIGTCTCTAEMYWGSDGASSSDSSVSDSVSEEWAVKRADGRPLGGKTQIDSSASSPSLKRTRFRFGGGVSGQQGAGASPWAGTGELGHLRDDLSGGSSSGAVAGTSAFDMVGGQWAVHREDCDERTDKSVLPTARDKKEVRVGEAESDEFG